MKHSVFEAVQREARQWEGVKLDVVREHKHVVLQIIVGAQVRRFAVAKRASDWRAGANEVARFRRLAKQLGASEKGATTPCPAPKQVARKLDKGAPIAQAPGLSTRQLAAKVYAQILVDRTQPHWQVLDAAGVEVGCYQTFADAVRHTRRADVFFAPSDGA